MSTSLGHRFVRGFAAQGFGQIVTLAVQVLGVPIFLHYWGISLYKDWLLLSAVLGYLQISDLSFAAAAANEMTMLESAGRREKVQSIYHSAFFFIACVCLVIFLLAIPIIWFVPMAKLLSLTVVQESDAKLALFLLTLQILIAQLGGIYFAAYRCAGQFAIGTVSANLVRLSEFLAIIGVVIFHGSVVTVALAYLITRILGCILTWIHLRYLVPWLHLGFKDANRAAIKKMMIPALSFNAFPIGQVMNVQGVLLVVNALHYPAAVVVALSTVRTLSRVLYQFAMVVSGIAWDELSRAFGRGDTPLAARIHRRACQIGLWGSLTMALLLALIGPAAYRLWTHNSIPLDYPFFLLLLVVSIVSGVWTISYVVPVSFNRHNRLAVIYVIVMSSTVLAAWVGAVSFGMMGIGVGLLLIELIMLVVVLKISLSMLEEEPRVFFSTLLTPPAVWLWHRLTSMYLPRPQLAGTAPSYIAAIPTMQEVGLPTGISLIEGHEPPRDYTVALGTLGRFHTFDLARQLDSRGLLNEVFSGYPWFKLKSDQIAKEKVHCHSTYPLLAILAGHLPLQNPRLQQALEWQGIENLDRYIAKHIKPCDVYIALASVFLHSGRKARELGAKIVCDRPCTHIRVQDRLLREAFDAAGVPWIGIDPRIIAKEEAEYAQADLILVPSTFSYDTFIERGISPDKLLVAPYGVDFSKFSPVGAPDPDKFDILFVGAASMRKGTPTLLQAFAKVQHPHKRLILIGAVLPEVREMVRNAAEGTDVEVMGIQPKSVLRKVMSHSHVLVLPSVEDGFGLVMAEAMACGCPVVASDHTGARDLFEHGKEGLIVEASNVDALAEALQLLADDPARRQSMAEYSLERVYDLGGWSNYAEIILGGLDRLQEVRQPVAR